MRILLAIASYGTANDEHLATILAQYRQIQQQIDIAVFSNISKNLGSDIRVTVGLPTKDPWSLPFAHKRLFAEQVDNYDLFIYSEDDSLVTERNIMAFLRATEILPDDEIAGFVRYETDFEQRRYFCEASTHWHWDPRSVTSRGEHIFAFFTNEHAALYVLTRRQLKRAIESGGFLVAPHTGRYKLPETAATDPYTQCGFKKMICISHLEDFMIHHLSNKYVGRLSLAEADFQRQVGALLQIHDGRRPQSELLGQEARLVSSKWAKSYYESVRQDLLTLIPAHVTDVLSIGCGWGATEGELVKRGIRVVAAPLDPVIAACAEARGVEIVYGDLATIQEQLKDSKFDCILISNVLHLMDDPTVVLRSIADRLNKRGWLIASVPNFAQLPTFLQRLRCVANQNGNGAPMKMSIHKTTHGAITRWLKSAGLGLNRAVNVVPPRAQFASRLSLGLGDKFLASQIIVVAQAQ